MSCRARVETWILSIPGTPLIFPLNDVILIGIKIFSLGAMVNIFNCKHILILLLFLKILDDS